MRASRVIATCLALLLLGPYAGSVLAADTKQADRERAAALSRAQEAVRRAEREKAALALEKKMLQDEQANLALSVKAAEDRASAAGRTLAQSRRTAQASAVEAEALRKEKAALTASIEALRAQVQKISDERNAAQKTIAVRDEDLGKLRAVAQARARVLAVCEGKNTKLYQTGLEVIDRMESRGFWETMRGAEPFARQRRVEFENLMEAYRDKVLAERIVSPSGQ